MGLLRFVSHLEGLPAYLKKKAILCALKIVRKVPAISDQFNSSFRHLLESTDHGVLLATISLMIEFCHLSDFDYKTQFQEKVCLNDFSEFVLHVDFRLQNDNCLWFRIE